jgi:hypothetical protein
LIATVSELGSPLRNSSTVPLLAPHPNIATLNASARIRFMTVSFGRRPIIGSRPWTQRAPKTEKKKTGAPPETTGS